MNESVMAQFENYAKWSQVVGSIVFAIALVVLFRRYLAPAVAAATIARNQRLAEAEARRAQVQHEIATARGTVEAASADAKSIADRAAADAQREHERLVAEAKADGERIVRNARGELERQRIAARDRLRVEFIEKALARARVQAAQRVDAATDAVLVRGTIDSLQQESR